MCLTVIFYSPKRNFIIYIPKGRCNLRNVINSRTAVHQVTVNSLSMGPGKGTSFTAQCVLGCHVILLSPPQCILTISWPLLEFQSVTGPANGKTRTLGSCPRTRIPSCWSGFHANPPASYSICFCGHHWKGGFTSRSASGIWLKPNHWLYGIWAPIFPALYCLIKLVAKQQHQIYWTRTTLQCSQRHNTCLKVYIPVGYSSHLYDCFQECVKQCSVPTPSLNLGDGNTGCWVTLEWTVGLECLNIWLSLRIGNIPWD